MSEWSASGDGWGAGAWAKGDAWSEGGYGAAKHQTQGTRSSPYSGGSTTSSSIGEQDHADIVQWVGCTRVGQCVPGTCIVPVKTPFEGSLADRAYAEGLISDEDWFSRDDLLRIAKEQGTPLGLVIDLVNTEKYYSGFPHSRSKIEYKKVRIPGRTIPEYSSLEEIFDLIDDFVSRRPDKYVAVHCTHGINRTGFVVAAYLMMRGNIPKCVKAVKAFEKARGTKIDKCYLLDALMRLEETGTY
eukprot:TRINITY_DN74643_c0_g1_i1.p1 TRINITY_DN74643_c0_g1~~TRINITY_DN74643_c0_g1_i1.p1  ORF type:complete len:243 (-),score=33.47 TRINITY_DN74643_c0_g1_i1:99-827(-)